MDDSKDRYATMRRALTTSEIPPSVSPHTHIEPASRETPVRIEPPDGAGKSPGPDPRPTRITILYLYLPFHNEPPVPFCTHKS